MPERSRQRIAGALIGLCLAMGFALFEAGPARASPPRDHLIAQSATLDVRDGESLSKGSWQLNKSLNPDVYVAQLKQRGERRRVCFISNLNEICRVVGEGQQADFTIHYDGHDYPTRIVGKYVAPAARFDAAYRENHRGKISVHVPEVYELVNVAIALTSYARGEEPLEARYLVMRESAYYRDVRRHFATVERHPFVHWLDRRLREGDYARVKMNAFAFEFDRSGRIVRSQIYDRIAFPGEGENSLLPALDAMRSFARQSDFRTFYASHRSLYAGQAGFLESGLGLEAMQAWLRREFPNVTPYDHVKVIFSPLVLASQSATWMESEGFRELQPHVNYPYVQNFKLPVSVKGKTLIRGNLLFTEINHGFVNGTPRSRHCEGPVQSRPLGRRRHIE